MHEQVASVDLRDRVVAAIDEGYCQVNLTAPTRHIAMIENGRRPI